MATITTAVFLDDTPARTAGETWTMNGGQLTIRTDTRWHATAPAGMLGSIGSTTISATLGGKVIINSNAVRWMPYNTGSGTVPSIGTTITQGGVSGYLLGVWASTTSAPTAVGAAMPTTGFLKFREVTGGTFAAGALAGITANATSPDVVGWIEVVQDQSAANTVPRLGEFVVNNDDTAYWFDLGTTTGVAGQVLQVPTNGGGAGTHVPAVWIETGVGTGLYEKYPAILATWYLAANLSTDVRCKFVQTIGSGQVRIGQDNALANAGYVPPAGCRVRVPNVFMRQTSAANRALNLVPHPTLGTRPDFVTTSAGAIRMTGVLSDWYHIFQSAFSVKIKSTAVFDRHVGSNEASPVELDDYCCGHYIAGNDSFQLTNCPLGGTITNIKFYRPDAASNGHSFTMTGCTGHVFDTVETGIIAYARSTGFANISLCRNMEFENFTLAAEGFQFSTCANITVNNLTFIDRLVGVTNSTGAKRPAQLLSACDNIIFDGLSFGPIADNNPYASVYFASNCSNLTFRNMGTAASPLDVNAAAAPDYIFQDGGNNDGIRVQRCYVNATRTGVYITVNTSKNITLESLVGTVGSLGTNAVNAQVKGLRAASNSVTGGAAVYGTHWHNMFTGDLTGRLWLAFNEPTAFSADQYEAVSLGAGAGFTSAGNIVMPNVGDQIIWTLPYFALGYTAFANIAPTLTGTLTGNFTYEFDLDTGTGFSGSWQTLTGTNLAAATISPTTGFRMKLRITTATAATTNALTFIRMDMVTTLSVQNAALYPLDTTTITLTGLQTNSRVQLYDVTNSTELYNAVVTGTSLTYATPYTADFDCRVRVMKQSGTTAYILEEFTETVGVSGLTRVITQELDTVYNLNAIDGSTVTGITIDDTSLLVEIDTGTLSWSDIYAYETYWLYTEEGIRDEARFMEALDQANYLFYNFQIKNIAFPSDPLTITGGWGRDAVTNETVTIIDTSGGDIFSNPDLVIPFATGSGVTPQDIVDIADAVWDETVAGHTTTGTTGKELSDAKSKAALAASLSA